MIDDSQETLSKPSENILSSFSFDTVMTFVVSSSVFGGCDIDAHKISVNIQAVADVVKDL